MKTLLHVLLAAGAAFGVAACQNTDTQDTVLEPSVNTVTFNVTGMT